jgi:hypothetical protein
MFTYRGEMCVLAHEKFGLRLRFRTAASEAEANKTLNEIAKKLRSSTRIVEKMILASAPDLLGRGEATVVNQHASLLAAYTYFRERALQPAVIEDKTATHKSTDGALTSVSYTFGHLQMQMHAFHDLVAAITAYVSLLEHDLVLALPFSGFDPEKDNLTGFIGSRWREKFDRILGKDEEAARYRGRLVAIVERWRNPYAHGGFEKGHGATIYLHVPDAGGLPVGLTSVHKSPAFSFIPASDSDIAEVFDLFDELDRWVAHELPHATKWISSGLPVSFDRTFRSTVASAIDDDEFDEFLDVQEHYHDVSANMDY